jgi:hypothetical protein
MKRLIFVILAIFVIAGCGGSSSSKKEVTIVAKNATGVAFKAKDGNWRDDLKAKDLGNGAKEYTIDYSGKYQVAIKCGSRDLLLVAYDSNIDNKVVHDCSINLSTGPKHYKGQISDSTGEADGFVTAMRTNYDIHNTSPANFDRDGEVMLNNDFVAITYKVISSTPVPKRLYIKRDIFLNSDITENISINSSNSALLESKNFSTNANLDKGTMYLITKNDTYFTSHFNNKWYYPKDGKLLKDGDLYLIYGKKGNNFLYDVYNALDIPKKSINIDLNYINNLTSLGYSANKITGLQSYSASSACQPLKGYTIHLKNSASKSIFIIISKAYLGSDDTFEIDDLSGLNNFTSSWDGQNASSVDGLAIMTNISFSTILNEGKMDRVSNSAKFLLVKNSKSELAYQKVK